MIDAGDALDNLCDEWPDEPLGWYTLADKREVAEMVLRHLRSRPVEERTGAHGDGALRRGHGLAEATHPPLCLGVIRCDSCEQPIGLDDIVAGDADHTWHLRCEPERAGDSVSRGDIWPDPNWRDTQNDPCSCIAGDGTNEQHMTKETT